MADNNKNEQLPDSDQAFAYLVNAVHAPVFFEKLAQDYGIVAGSDEERMGLLEMAGILQNVRAQDRVKQASAGHSPIISALDELKQGLARSGGYPGMQALPTSQDNLIKAAAHRMVADSPDLQAAAVAWAIHEAQQAGS